jgi:hypothetical protein
MLEISAMFSNMQNGCETVKISEVQRERSMHYSGRRAASVEINAIRYLRKVSTYASSLS